MTEEQEEKSDENTAHEGRLRLICAEHVWTSTFNFARCPFCDQRERELKYKEQKDASLLSRAKDSAAKSEEISGNSLSTREYP